MVKALLPVCIGLLPGLLFTAAVQAQATPVAAATQFLASLNPQQAKSCRFDLNDPPLYNWHFFPKNDRVGVPIGQMNPAQLQLAFALMHSSFSKAGFDQARQVMQLEGVLKAMENRRDDDHYRDTGKYYFCIFGTPAEGKAWAWRLEGHHLSYSFSAIGNQFISGSPGFLGANPALVPEGPHKGMEVLRNETSLAFQLMNSLRPEQRKQALVSNKAPGEILSFVSRKAIIENTGGISFAQLKRNQQFMMEELIEQYILRYTKLFADDMLKEMHTAGLDKLVFSWAGSTDAVAGKAYYYRISGPTLLIEFDNAQNNANHIHTVVRDLVHDFGGDLLLEHYQKDH